MAQSLADGASFSPRAVGIPSNDSRSRFPNTSDTSSPSPPVYHSSSNARGALRNTFSRDAPFYRSSNTSYYRWLSIISSAVAAITLFTAICAPPDLAFLFSFFEPPTVSTAATVIGDFTLFFGAWYAKSEKSDCSDVNGMLYPLGSCILPS